MNKQNFNILIEDLKQYPQNFNAFCYFNVNGFGYWAWCDDPPIDRIAAHESGTTACIAGRALCYMTEIDKKQDLGYMLHKWLEIPMLESNWLIGGHYDQWNVLEKIPVENAIKALEYIRDGGDMNVYKG